MMFGLLTWGSTGCCEVPAHSSSKLCFMLKFDLGLSSVTEGASDCLLFVTDIIRSILLGTFRSELFWLCLASLTMFLETVFP